MLVRVFVMSQTAGWKQEGGRPGYVGMRVSQVTLEPRGGLMEQCLRKKGERVPWMGDVCLCARLSPVDIRYHDKVCHCHTQLSQNWTVAVLDTLLCSSLAWISLMAKTFDVRQLSYAQYLLQQQGSSCTMLQTRSFEP